MKPIFLIPVLALTATSSQAALVLSRISAVAGTSWDSSTNWDHATAGEPDSGAVAGNDYRSVSGHTIRTLEANASTFGGDSLTIVSGSTLATKNGTGTDPHTIEIADLRLSGGTISNFGNGNKSAIFTGKVTATTSTTSTINNSPTAGRGISFDSLVTGSGTLRLIGDTVNSNIVAFNNASNTFTGLFDVRQGTIDFNYNHFTTASLTLSQQGKLVLDQNLAFQAVTINGDSLAIGSYTQDELVTSNAAYAAFFSGSSTGNTITVIPEPSALVLGCIGALALLRRRR